MYLLPIVLGIALAAVSILLAVFVAPRSSRADWAEVSRGEWLRAIRHVPTGRCFVRATGGGVVETDVDVCRVSR
jgi:hypothetical protein